MDFTKFIEAIKLKPEYLFPISLFTGLIIFSPNKFLDNLGVQKFANDYRFWFGLIFLGSSTFLMSHGILSIISLIRQKTEDHQRLKVGRKRLHQLTPSEVEILSFYIVNNTRTQTCDIRNGVVLGLEKDNIIYLATPSSKVKHMTDPIMFDFNIHFWAWSYLNEHKELLGLEN